VQMGAPEESAGAAGMIERVAVHVDAISVDATDDIGPTKINYRVVPSGVCIPSVTFEAPGMNETRANVAGSIMFTYNQTDLPFGGSSIVLSYNGGQTALAVEKQAVSAGPAEEIVIATVPVGPDQGWVNYPITHQLREAYWRITYSGAPVVPGSYTLQARGSVVSLEADPQVTINAADERHRYHDADRTYPEEPMALVTGETLPATTAYRKWYDLCSDRFFKPGNALQGIAQVESVRLDGQLPLNLANEEIDQSLE